MKPGEQAPFNVGMLEVVKLGASAIQNKRLRQMGAKSLMFRKGCSEMGLEKTEQLRSRAKTSLPVTIMSGCATRIAPAVLQDRKKVSERPRDHLAHADAYVGSVAKAKRVCAVVWDIYALGAKFLAVVQGPPR